MDGHLSIEHGLVINVVAGEQSDGRLQKVGTCECYVQQLSPKTPVE